MRIFWAKWGTLGVARDTQRHTSHIHALVPVHISDVALIKLTTVPIHSIGGTLRNAQQG